MIGDSPLIQHEEMIVKMKERNEKPLSIDLTFHHLFYRTQQGGLEYI